MKTLPIPSASLTAVTLTLSCFSGSFAKADLLVEEEFIYGPGENIHAQNGGLGFDGAWVSTISHGRIYDIQPTGLSFSTLRVDGNSVSRFGAAGRAQAHRPMLGTAQTALTGDNTTIWFSLLFKAPSAHRYAAFLFGTGAFTTGTSPILATAGDGFGLTLVAADGVSDGGGTINALAFDNSTTPTVATSSYNPGTATSLIVGKINWKPNGTADELFLFNVTDLETEPAEGTAIASITNLDLDQSAINTVAIWDTNNAVTDEIRFGTTFSGAMGIQPDTDGDGMSDAFEMAHTSPPSPTALEPGDDLEDGGVGDGLTNLQEFQYETDPNDSDSDDDTLTDGAEVAGAGSRPPTNPAKADTDDDTLDDLVETNSGSFVSAADTGTNPAVVDTDLDGLVDGVEVAAYLAAPATATHPLMADTDSDGAGDWYELVASFTDPVDPADKPNIPYPLPDPDGSTGATDKPVKVYIMSGQSNMVGFGSVSGSGSSALTTMTRTEHKFPNLIDSEGNFIARQDVRYRGVISAIGNGPLAPGFGANGNSFGPELGFGQVMGWSHDEPVLLIKSSIGNRSLGWDVLPPGSPSYVYNNTNYAGYGDYGNWPVGGSPPTSGGWYAGKEFDRFFMDEADWVHADPADVNVVDILDNWVTEYSAAGKPFAGQDFEIAGFVWWQGDKDRYDMGLATRYEVNLVKLITSLRDYYTNRYPGKVVNNAPFVLATLGQTPLNSTNAAEKAILDAQLAVDGESGIYPQFAGNVKTVYSHPLSEGGASNGHYNLRAGTYMLVGDALGRAMVELQETATPDDYDIWAANYPGSDLSDPNGDFDGDGFTNDWERLFGTDPTDNSSANPMIIPLDATGAFSYTRRDDSLTGKVYSIWTSTTMQPGSWVQDFGATQGEGPPDGNDVETISVTLSAALMTNPELFVRVAAD